MCSSSSATRFPTSSDVLSINVTLPTALLSVDSASDKKLSCNCDEDSKVERDADTDSQSDPAVNVLYQMIHLSLQNQVVDHNSLA